MKQITSAYQRTSSDGTGVVSGVRTFWRRPRLAVQLPHTIVLPTGTTAARLTVLGWGRLRVWAAGAPRQVPVARRFIWGKETTLDLTVPVGTKISVVATNVWGSVRIRFEVMPTHPATPTLPQFARPRSIPPMPPSSLHIPAAQLGMAFSDRARVNTALLKPKRLRSGYVPSQLGVPLYAGPLARMSSNLRRAVSQLDRVTATNIQSKAEEH